MDKNGCRVEIIHKTVSVYDANGKLLRQESITDYTKENVRGEYATLDAFIREWRADPKKDKIRERIAAAEAAGEAYCPKCGSTSLTANKKGYGIGKGLIGAAVIANPIGLVAGNIGRQKVLVTCLNCGYQFKPGKK